ncbi:hypothetical protein GQ44DRAFT_728466 [Phaeosphaeriaceae sp. PMI808]|nr:hypothetical protein GQ44DRAFT_728466 [Phaeosphaeriaceae sp. PMI808]
MQSSSRQPRKWTLAEDDQLREEVEAQLTGGGDVKDWCRIASKLPGRTNKDCRKRWHNSVAGGLKKGQWSKSEDELLHRGVQQHGQRWTLVANCVESRSADQCAKRWQQSLDPAIDKSEWREEEDHTLIEATKRLGRHWKDIQRDYFPGRSKNCIKNRYTVLVRRYGITLPSHPSSPSEPSSPPPRSSYTPDDEYSPFPPTAYNTLMPPHFQGTSSNRRSWSGYDNVGAPSWSSPQEYDLQMAMSTINMTHATNSMPGYSYASPRTLGTSVSSPSNDWDWPTTSLNHSTPMHVTSPILYDSAENPAQPHYDDYGMSRPVMSSGRSYSRPTARASYPGMPHTAPTNMPRTRAWSEQQYDSLSPINYPDSRPQQDPVYRY